MIKAHQKYIVTFLNRFLTFTIYYITVTFHPVLIYTHISHFLVINCVYCLCIPLPNSLFSTFIEYNFSHDIFVYRNDGTFYKMLLLGAIEFLIQKPHINIKFSFKESCYLRFNYDM